MKKLTLTFLIIFFTLTSNVVWSDETNLSGYQSCGNFLDACDENKLHINCQTQTFWTLGYVSSKLYSQNIWISSIAFNQDSFKYALIKFCRQNPLKDTHDGAEDIFNQLR
jgi:hypothetical protein